jgi:hypothetical protein
VTPLSRPAAFSFRPPQQEDIDHDGKVVDDWEDNALSNFMAWTSQKFLRNWCQTPEHWTSRVTNYLYTSCPCCMFYRGVALATIIQVPLFVIVLILVAARS